MCPKTTQIWGQFAYIGELGVFLGQKMGPDRIYRGISGVLGPKTPQNTSFWLIFSHFGLILLVFGSFSSKFTHFRLIFINFGLILLILCHFGPYSAHFGVFWTHFGVFWTHFGYFGAYFPHFGVFWRYFGVFWGIITHFRGILAHFRHIWRYFEVFWHILGTFGPVLRYFDDDLHPKPTPPPQPLLFLEIFIHISSTYNNRFFVLLNSIFFTIVFKSTSWLRISAKIIWTTSVGLSIKVLCDKIIFVLFKL